MPEQPRSKPPSLSDLSSRSSATEVYGFVAFLLTIVAFTTFLLWAYVPERWYRSIGITYYPDKYWAVALPAWVSMSAIFFLVAYYAKYLMNTPPLDDRLTFTDGCAKGERPTLGAPMKDALLPVADIPITVVNRFLYQRHVVSR